MSGVPIPREIVDGAGNRLTITSAGAANVKVVDPIVIGTVTVSVDITGDTTMVQKAGEVYRSDQSGGWSVGISGDVSLQSSYDRIIGRVAGPQGVQIVGTSVGQYGISGDVSLQSSYDRIVGRVAGPLGVQVVGTSVGQYGVSGDVTTVPKAGERWPVSVQTGGGSGDVNLVDGADRSIKSTVKDYANSNPLAVALVNASGDTYSAAQPFIPPLETKSGTHSSQGSRLLAAGVAGKRLYVTAYDLQAFSDQAYAHFASNASGDPLTPRWLFSAREGVAKHVSNIGGSCIFRTGLSQGISLEHAGQNLMFSISYFSGDA